MSIVKATCLGFPLFIEPLKALQYNKKLLINTINQYSYCMAQKDASFKKALMESDVLLPDGIGIVAAHKLLTGQSISKIAGADIHNYLLEKLNLEHGSCFYLGASEATLTKIKARIAREYPNIKVGAYSPPYKSQFTSQDNISMTNAINAFKPDVLFIGMTAPKQEKWAYMHKNQLETGIICSIGAVFDFYAGTVQRPGAFWVNLGLEWAGRLIKEPKRMWKRYLYYGPVFLMDLFKAKVKQNFVYGQ